MLFCFTSEFDCGVGHLVFLFFLHLSLITFGVVLFYI